MESVGGKRRKKVEERNQETVSVSNKKIDGDPERKQKRNERERATVDRKGHDLNPTTHQKKNPSRSLPKEERDGEEERVPTCRRRWRRPSR